MLNMHTLGSYIRQWVTVFFNTVQNVCNRMIFFTLPAASNFPSLMARLKTINTVKSLLKKAEDPYMAMLYYRSTSSSSGFTAQ